MKQSSDFSLLVLLLFAVSATPCVASEAEPVDGDKKVENHTDAPGRIWSARGVVGPEGPLEADRGFRMPPPRIVNRVIDLLEDEVALTTEEGSETWMSEIFYTSQFNRIILRSSSEGEGIVTCEVGWRFGRGEAFRFSYPMQTFVQPVLPLSVPDGVPDLSLRQRQYYPYYAPDASSAEVRGLQARVRCTLWDARADYGRLEDDPGLIDPNPTDPVVPIVGSLTDVKVLLRRE